MSPRPARRAATLSAGALALCLSAAGTAYADTPPLPPLPSPDNVITAVDQAVTQVTGVDPGLASPTSTSPAGAPQTAAPTTTTKRPAPLRTARRPATAPAATAAPASVSPASTVTWVPAADAGALSLPPATTTAMAAGGAPAIAPLLMPHVTQRITPAAAMLQADKHTGSPVRGLLLTLAVAAAVGLGYEHGRLARRGASG